MYVVISSPDDDHIRYVERHLDQPFVLLSTRDILEDDTYSFEVRGKQTTVRKSGKSLVGVKSVWYRRMMLIQDFELPVGEGKKKYSQTAIKFFNRLLFAQFSDALWVSDYFAIQRANDKLLQLQVASRLGFNVPETLFTSSADEALAFVKSHKAVVAKPNYSSRFMHDGKQYAFFTSRVDASTDFTGFRLAPAILQQAIEVQTELRITVVGDKVFAASIDTGGDRAAAHVRDWRVTDLSAVTFRPFELPKQVSDRCVALVKELGLRYGAMDAIIDRRGKLWFLENNPIGQWAFVEDDTGLPIGKALAMLLMSRK